MTESPGFLQKIRMRCRPRLAAGDLADHILNRRLGRLPLFEKASGVLTCFSPKPYPDSPRSIDIALHEKPGDDSVWFSAATGDPAIYRFGVGQQMFEKHKTTSSSWPRYLALDVTGSAWVTDINGNSLIFCPKGKSCGEAIFQSKKFTLDKVRQQLIRKEFKAQPTLSKTPSRAVTVTKKEYPCALRSEEHTSELQSLP